MTDTSAQKPDEREPHWLTPPLALIVLGAVVLVVGIALFSWRVAVIAAGVMLLIGGVDLTRPDQTRQDTLA